MNSLHNIVVYCGSNLGQDKAFFDAAQDMGRALALGGRVVGVIPTFLKQKEVAHLGLSELIETADMTTRKNTMIALAHGFIAMPGGLGTYEELFEVLSQAQLQLHPHPVGVLNINGFFEPLLALLRDTVRLGFMPAANLSLLCVADNPSGLLSQMAAWRPQEASKWIQPTWTASA